MFNEPPVNHWYLCSKDLDFTSIRQFVGNSNMTMVKFWGLYGFGIKQKNFCYAKTYSIADHLIKVVLRNASSRVRLAVVDYFVFGISDKFLSIRNKQNIRTKRKNSLFV